MLPAGVLLGILIEGATGLGEEEDKVFCLGRVLRVFPIDVEAVEAEVGEELDCGAGEGLASGRGGGGLGEVGGVGPAADGEEGFKVAVLLFEEEELLDAAVDVGADVVPAVGGVVFFEVGVGVG